MQKSAKQSDQSTLGTVLRMLLCNLLIGLSVDRISPAIEDDCTQTRKVR